LLASILLLNQSRVSHHAEEAAMKQSMTAQLTKFYEAAYLNLPLAAARRWLGGGPVKLEVAGWAAYDSFVALANEMTNQMYASRLVVESFGRVVETAFQLGYIFDALAPKPALSEPEPRLESNRLAALNLESIESRHAAFARRGAHFAEATVRSRSDALARRPARRAAVG
jgi:hypothetical protein